MTPFVGHKTQENLQSHSKKNQILELIEPILVHQSIKVPVLTAGLLSTTTTLIPSLHFFPPGRIQGTIICRENSQLQDHKSILWLEWGMKTWQLDLLREETKFTYKIYH